ncbi:MAG: glycosyltransferase family 4 protein [Bacteroidota bacterium]
MDKPNIVIVSTNFGTNFSGGSTVTAEVFARIQDDFKQIVFVGSQVGEHAVRNLIFIQSRNWIKTYFLLRKLKKTHTLFYGDFYDSFLLALARTNYVFTYHDNWPELAGLGLRQYFHSLFYNPIYSYIFRNAAKLTTVSEYKKQLIAKQTATKVKVIPNGFNQIDGAKKETGKSGILMVGNIDQRKYKLAIELFNTIDLTDNLRIDIYGHIVDPQVAKHLKKFPFVTLKGFNKEIPYSSYQFLLHTSFIESFGMVFLEAISQGLPVLAFDRGGAKEIISEGNGVLITPYEIDSMRDTLFQLLNYPKKSDPTTVIKYSWEKATESYRKVFAVTIGV